MENSIVFNFGHMHFGSMFKRYQVISENSERGVRVH